MARQSDVTTEVTGIVAARRQAGTLAPSNDATDRPRYLRDPADGRGDYTTLPSLQMWNCPEPVDPEWLDAHLGIADSTGDRSTKTTAAAHAIEAILRHEGPTDSVTLKARIVWALDVSERAVERAAKDMADLVRKRGLQSATIWSLTGDSVTFNREGATTLTPATIREHVDIARYGARQDPIATAQEVAAELLADQWAKELKDVMNADDYYETRTGWNQPT
jgi:hypothetical protein